MTPEFDLSAADIRALIDHGNIQLVDVREADEWANGHIAGAILCPLSQIQYGAAPPDSLGKARILYCAGGVRSVKAAQILKARGTTVDHHLTGGIRAWVAEGYEVV